jgi:hypothetical protein
MTGRSIVAVLPSRAEAERAIARLHSAGVPPSSVSLVAPRGPEEHGENEGIGAVIGSVVGGAGGASLALATVGLVVPGVGPVVLFGALASALAGAAGGAAVGSTLDRAATDAGAPDGRPEEAPRFYRDALREGRTLVVLPADGATERHAALLRESGAVRVEIVGDDWWRGLHVTENSPAAS